MAAATYPLRLLQRSQEPTGGADLDHDTLHLSDGRRIAFRRTIGAMPGIVFLGGFRSDMSGTKASYLEAWARARGQAFLQFDYTGHGASSGQFRDGTIGSWARDAEDALLRLSSGPQVIVGSSMGGWIGLLLAARIPAQIAGFVGIAAAPDFTEDAMWGMMDATARGLLLTQGEVHVPSAYSDETYPITAALIEDGRKNLLLRRPLALPFPVRLLHGTADADVDPRVALRILERAEGGDIRLTLVKGADHQFSEPANLALIARTLEGILPS